MSERMSTTQVVLSILGIALACGVLGGLLGLGGSTWMAKLHNWSNFEGGAGMAIAFFYTPGGFLLGAILGAIVAWQTGVADAGPMKALVNAAGTVGGVGGAIIGIGLLMKLAEPGEARLDGQALVIDVEVRFPPGRALPDSSDGEFHVTVYSGSGDNRHYATPRWDRVYSSEGRLVLPATGPLNLVQSNRKVTVTFAGGEYYWFDTTIPAQPDARDLQWIDWWPGPGQNASSYNKGDVNGFQIRYRVRKVADAFAFDPRDYPS